MNCYKHPNIHAVGICKYCMKGLCTDCAVEMHNALSCKASCEEEVKQINVSQNNQPTIQSFAKTTQKIGSLGLLAYGIYLAVY